MNKEDVIRMAREAGILEPIDLLKSNQWQQDTIRELVRFAALVAAAEREACLASLNDLTLDHKSSDYYNGWLDMRDACAASIRDRNK